MVKPSHEDHKDQQWILWFVASVHFHEIQCQGRVSDHFDMSTPESRIWWMWWRTVAWDKVWRMGADAVGWMKTSPVNRAETCEKVKPTKTALALAQNLIMMTREVISEWVRSKNGENTFKEECSHRSSSILSFFVVLITCFTCQWRVSCTLEYAIEAWLHMETWNGRTIGKKDSLWNRIAENFSLIAVELTLY